MVMPLSDVPTKKNETPSSTHFQHSREAGKGGKIGDGYGQTSRHRRVKRSPVLVKNPVASPQV